MKALLLYFATALAEIVGCYLPWLWLRQGGSAWHCWAWASSRFSHADWGPV